MNEKTLQAFQSLNNSTSEFLTADEMTALNGLLNKLLNLSEDKILSGIESRICGEKEETL